MKNFLISVFLFFSIGLCTAQEKEIFIPYFEGKTITGLQIDGACDVFVRQGEPSRVMIEKIELSNSDFVCKLNSGVLRLEYRDRTRDHLSRRERDSYREKRIKAIVTVSRLDYVSVMGISSVAGTGRFTSSDCLIWVGNVSSVNNLDISTRKFSLIATNVGKAIGLKLNVEQSADFSVANVALIDRLSLHASDVSMTVYNCGKIHNTDLKVSREMRLTQLNVSEVDIDCTSPKVSLKLLNVSKLNGKGNVDNLDIQMSNCTHADIENLSVKNIVCSLANLSKLRCSVSDKASFSVDRNCEILYRGSPEISVQNTPSVRKID